jgi:hypothetical protein
MRGELIGRPTFGGMVVAMQQCADWLMGNLKLAVAAQYRLCCIVCWADGRCLSVLLSRPQFCLSQLVRGSWWATACGNSQPASLAWPRSVFVSNSAVCHASPASAWCPISLSARIDRINVFTASKCSGLLCSPVDYLFSRNFEQVVQPICMAWFPGVDQYGDAANNPQPCYVNTPSSTLPQVGTFGLYMPPDIDRTSGRTCR